MSCCDAEEVETDCELAFRGATEVIHGKCSRALCRLTALAESSRPHLESRLGTPTTYLHTGHRAGLFLHGLPRVYAGLDHLHQYFRILLNVLTT